MVLKHIATLHCASRPGKGLEAKTKAKARPMTIFSLKKPLVHLVLPIRGCFKVASTL